MAGFQCDAKKTKHQLKSLPKTCTVMGGRLNPGCFAEYKGISPKLNAWWELQKTEI
jgi:hypothetical protein